MEITKTPTYTCRICHKPTSNFNPYSPALQEIIGKAGDSVCDKCIERIVALSEWQNEQDATDNLICPWCGYENRDSWELPDEDDDFYECPECGKTFEYAVEITRTFTSRRRKRDYPGKLAGDA